MTYCNIFQLFEETKNRKMCDIRWNATMIRVVNIKSQSKKKLIDTVGVAH